MYVFSLGLASSSVRVESQGTYDTDEPSVRSENEAFVRPLLSLTNRAPVCSYCFGAEVFIFRKPSLVSSGVLPDVGDRNGQ